MLGPPNKEVAEYLRKEYRRLLKFKAPGAYVDALFLGNFSNACAELQRTLRALSADMVPQNGTAVHGSAWQCCHWAWSKWSGMVKVVVDWDGGGTL